MKGLNQMAKFRPQLQDLIDSGEMDSSPISKKIVEDSFELIDLCDLGIKAMCQQADPS